MKQYVVTTANWSDVINGMDVKVDPDDRLLTISDAVSGDQKSIVFQAREWISWKEIKPEAAP